MKRIKVDYRELDLYFDWTSYWNDIKNEIDFKSRVKKFKKNSTSDGYIIQDNEAA